MTPQADSEGRMVRLFQPLLLTAMITCMAVPVIAVGEGLLAGWNGDYLLVMTPLAVLEGVAALRFQQRARDYGWERVGRVVTELTLLLLATKLLSYAAQGLPALGADVGRWLREPLRFFDGDTLPAAALVLLARGTGRSVLGALDELGVAGAVGDDVRTALDSVRSFILWGAVWMLAWSGFIVLLSELQPQLLSLLSFRVQLAFVAFFALSLLLLAHANYLRRRALWRIEDIPVPGIVSRRWITWGVALTAGVFLVASLLPSGGSLASWKLLGWLITLAFLAGQVIFLGLIVLLSPVLRFVLSLFTPAADQTAAELPTLPPGPSLEDLLGFKIDWRLVLQRSLEGLIVLILAVALLYLLSRRRRVPVPSVERAVGWLRRWLRDLGTQWGEFVESLRAWLARLRGRSRLAWNRLRASRFFLRPAAGEEGGWLGLLRAGTPRARIRRYYLTLLRRAESAGHRRLPHETPQEYAASLARAVAENERELEILTQAFMEARYNQREVEAEEIPPVRRAWQSLRRLLRPRREAADGADGRRREV